MLTVEVAVKVKLEIEAVVNVPFVIPALVRVALLEAIPLEAVSGPTMVEEPVASIPEENVEEEQPIHAVTVSVPFTRALPLTANLLPGVVVPMPKLPELVIMVCVALDVLKTRSVASVVPMKLMLLLRPELPVKFQAAPPAANCTPL